MFSFGSAYGYADLPPVKYADATGGNGADQAGAKLPPRRAYQRRYPMEPLTGWDHCA